MREVSRNSFSIAHILFAAIFAVSCSDAPMLGDGATGKKSGPSFGPQNPNNINKSQDQFGAGVPNIGDNSTTDRKEPLRNRDDSIAQGQGFDSMNIECEGENLVLNSKFDDGNAHINSNDYRYQTSPEPHPKFPGEVFMPSAQSYVITGNPNSGHRFYTSLPEDDGNMMVINFPESNLLENFWCQELSVKENELYQISVDLRRATANPSITSRTEWLIEGDVFTDPFNPQTSWGKYLKTWVSDRTGKVRLCGRNAEAAEQTGDLVIDNLKFLKCYAN